MSTTKELTQEQKEAKKKLNKEWADRRKAAMTVILDFMEEKKEDLTQEQKNAYLVFKGTGRRTSTRGVKHEIYDFIKENGGKAHEDEVYSKFKQGRTDIRTMFNTFLKGEPADRVWLQLNKETCEYEILNEGPDMPENWEGYIPEDLQAVNEDLPRYKDDESVIDEITEESLTDEDFDDEDFDDEITEESPEDE